MYSVFSESVFRDSVFPNLSFWRSPTFWRDAWHCSFLQVITLHRCVTSQSNQPFHVLTFVSSVCHFFQQKQGSNKTIVEHSLKRVYTYGLHMRFPHCIVFLMYLLIGSSKISSLKTWHSEENSYINWKCKRAFNDVKLKVERYA